MVDPRLVGIAIFGSYKICVNICSPQNSAADSDPRKKFESGSDKMTSSDHKSESKFSHGIKSSPAC